MIATLMFMTFAAAAGFGLIQLLAFLQRGSNRAAAENALVGDSKSAPYAWSNTNGALPDLLVVAGILIVAMLLLTAGYSFRG